MQAKTTQQIVTKEWMIGEIVEKYPETAEIMLSYGLHCIGCHVNPFESLEDGVLGHGMSEETLGKMLDDINSMVEQTSKPVEGLALTEKAAEKLKEIMKNEKKEGYGLRLDVVEGGCAGFSYNMDFDKSPKKTDKVFEDKGVKIFIDSANVEKVNGARIEFLDGLHGTGFKVNNPNASSTCGCGKSFS